MTYRSWFGPGGTSRELLRREGWLINRKHVRRLYRLDGLQLRMRVRRRKHIALHRGPAPTPVGPTKCWSMDFVHDTLADGRPFRILTVVDNWSRHSPVLEAGFRMTGETVSQVLDRVLGEGQRPRSITVDSWDGIPISSAGRLSLSAWGATPLHSTRQACGKRLD